MRYRLQFIGAVLSALLQVGCSFSSVARNWNGLTGEDNKPKYYVRTTKVGCNLLIGIPFIGDMSVPGLTTAVTSTIKQQGGNEVRIVEGSSETYFYGWPPFTWIITPVVSTVSAEYVPDPDSWATEQAALAASHYHTGHWYEPWTW